MAKALRLVLAMVFLAFGVGGLRADPYCDFYAGKLTSPGVYVARCADNVDCLLGPLPQGTPYEVDHRYRTVVFASGANAHNNSVVVAKIKYLSGAPTAAAPPIAVEMQRDNIPFVCFGSAGSVLPPEREQNADAYDAAHKLIHYDEYDRFHRFVEVRSDDQKWLQRTFHFSFKAKSSDWLFQC